MDSGGVWYATHSVGRVSRSKRVGRLWPQWRCGPRSAWGREDVVHYLHAFAVCSAGQHTFVGGLSGSAIAFDGCTWTPHSTPVHQHLRGLAAESPDQVIAVGLEGTLLHSDGESWAEMHNPARAHFEAIWLDDAGRGFPVGTLPRFSSTTAGNGAKYGRGPIGTSMRCTATPSTSLRWVKMARRADSAGSGLIAR